MGITFVVTKDNGGINTCHYEDNDGRFFLVWTHVDEDTKERVYSAYRLTDDEWLQQDVLHENYERKVGTHCCLHLPPEQRKKRSSIDLSFYGDARPTPRYAHQDPVKLIGEDEMEPAYKQSWNA